MAATIRQVIEARLADSNVVPNEITLDALLVEHDLGDGARAYAKSDAQSVKTIQLSILNDLITKRIQEGDMSIEFDMDRIAARCAELKNELGLTAKKGVVDRSNRW